MSIYVAEMRSSSPCYRKCESTCTCETADGASPIVGEHWRVFDTTVDTPEESRIGSCMAFPRYREKQERRSSAQKIFAEHITRIMLQVISCSSLRNGWEICENI